MEKSEVTLIFEYDESYIDWKEFPERQVQVGESRYIFPKNRFAEMAFIVNDFKQQGKKVTVII